MWLCLRCKRLNRSAPPGSDNHYCEGCAGTRGCRLCEKKKHLNSVTASFCSVCGSSKLSEPVSALPLGCLPRLLSWLLLIWLGRALLQGLPALLNKGWPGAVQVALFGSGAAPPGQSLGQLLGLFLNRIGGLVAAWTALALLLWMLGTLLLTLLPDEVAQPLQKAAQRLWRGLIGGIAILLSGTLRLLGKTARLVFELVEDRRPPNKTS